MFILAKEACLVCRQWIWTQYRAVQGSRAVCIGTQYRAVQGSRAVCIGTQYGEVQGNVG